LTLFENMKEMELRMGVLSEQVKESGGKVQVDLTGEDSDDGVGEVDDVVDKFLNEAIKLGVGPSKMGLITISDSDLAAVAGAVDWEVLSTTD